MDRKAVTKQKILDSALLVFAKDGYELASTNEIAKKAGVSKGVIFKHYKSKSGLYYELFLSELNRMTNEFEKLMLDVFSDPMEKFSQMILWKIDYANRHADATKLLSEAVSKPPNEIALVIQSHIAQLQVFSIQRFFSEIPMDSFREGYERSDVLRNIQIAATGLQAVYVTNHPDFLFSEEARKQCMDFMRIVIRGMEKSQ